MNGLSIAPIANLIDRVTPFQSRHIHDLSFAFPIARTNQYMYSFSPIQFYLWNNLPDSVVHSNSVVTSLNTSSLYLGCMLALAVCSFMHKFQI